MTEDAATAIALQDISAAVPVTLISGHAPAEEWVFSGAIGDFGRATAISVRSGLTVFQGGLDWGGPFGGEGGPRGGVLSLGSTESSSDLGSGCGSTTALPLASYDLRYGADSAARPEAALSAVLATALPPGLQQWGSLLDAVVLTYAGREQAPSEAWKANYVVLLNAGAAR